jgi:Flp pilus assembly pilin Flp
MPSFFQHFFARFPGRKPRRAKGQTLVEYALILALMSIALIFAFKVLSNQVIVVFSAMTTLLDTQQASH